MPSYSLDILTLLIVAAGNVQVRSKGAEAYCSAIPTIDPMSTCPTHTVSACSICNKVNELEIFDLLR